jgi:transposase
MLKDEATKNPKLYRNTADHKNYLIYTPMNDNADKFDISLKLDKVKELYKNKGWFFILSNEISDYKEALRIYRQKDVVEKAFLRLKNNLDLNRLRTHNDITTENKLFIGFISLIFSSYIHKIMEKEGLYLLYTQKSLFKKLDALKFIYSNQQLTLKPISKTHEDIFKAFEFFIDKVNK